MSSEDFYDRLQMVKARKNAKDVDLAKALGVTDRTVFNMNKGKSQPKAINLITLSERWGVDIHWLLTGEGTMFFADRNKGKEKEQNIDNETDPIIRRIREVERIYKDVDASTEEILEAVKLVLHTSAHSSRVANGKTSPLQSVKLNTRKKVVEEKKPVRKLRMDKSGPGSDDAIHFGPPEDVLGNDQPKDS